MVDTIQHEHHINRTNPLVVLLIMSCVIVSNSVENPYLRIIIGYRSNDRKKIIS